MTDEKELLSLLEHPNTEHPVELDRIFGDESTTEPRPSTKPEAVPSSDTAPTESEPSLLSRPKRLIADGGEEELRLLCDVRDPARSLHIDVLVALSPLLLWAIYLYGLRPLTLTLLAVGASIVFEFLCRRLFLRAAPPDLTPVITGVVLAFGLPPSAPLWLPVLGALIAILPLRQLFGGTGRNLVNPAAASLLCLYLAFPSLMTNLPATGQRLSAFSFTVKGFAAAERSAIETLLDGFLPEESFGRLFFGLRAGTLGEMSAFLLVGALIYLLRRRILRLSLPLTYLIAVAALAFAFPSLTAASDITALHGALYHVLDSNTLFVAVFLLGDPVTTPKTPWGAILAGFLGGAATFGLRLIAAPAASATAAVLIVNILSPLLDRFCRPAPFGGRQPRKQ